MNRLLVPVLLLSVPFTFAQKSSVHLPSYSSKPYRVSGGSVQAPHHAAGVSPVPASKSSKQELEKLESKKVKASQAHANPKPVWTVPVKHAPITGDQSVHATYQKPKGGVTSGAPGSGRPAGNRVPDRKPTH